jgi:glycosyltransferase EpsF
MRVLHVIENFNGQAVETYLYQMLKHLNEVGEKVDWTFYSTLGRTGKLDDAVRAMGGKILYSPVPLKNKMQFLKALRKTIAGGEYDILHCHHDIMSAGYLFAAAGLPLKKRIVHIYNTSMGLPTPNRLKKAVLHWPMRLLCLYTADHIVGISGEALRSFIGEKKPRMGRDMVVHCGIDTAPFHGNPPERTEFLQSLNLAPNSKILLFTGRMNDYKNPLFVIDILEILTRLDPAFCSVFVGLGPLMEEVRRKAKQKSLENRVRVMGWQEELRAFMQSCDLLICPSLEHPKEGLCLVVIEAQTAGLPVLMSLSASEATIVVPELVLRLSLKSGPEVWADAAIQILNRDRPSKNESLAKIESSFFSISHSASSIMALYENFKQ